MFIPQTERIKNLANKNPKVINDLERVFDDTTSIYIDFANVIHWQDKLGWHICLKRLKQFLDSFDTIKKINLYYGTLEDNPESQTMIKDIKNYGYILITKKVKIIKKSIDTTSIDISSTSLLKNFIRKPLLDELKTATIEILNNELKDLNRRGILFLEDKKCNFDVELGIDILNDEKEKNIKNFILWSGDSDFAFPVQELLKHDKKVAIFSTARKSATELVDTQSLIFDIRRIKEFICWKREMSNN